MSFREKLKVRNYSKICWSRKTKAGSPHLHVIQTYGVDGDEGEEFCFWATGWRQLVYKQDTMTFNFSMSDKPKKRKRVPPDFLEPEGPEEFWKVIDLKTLRVWDRKGDEVKRGYGPVARGKKYGYSGRF